MLPRPLTIALAVLVSLAWAVNVVVGFLYPDRHDASINAIFAVVIGAVFALGKKPGSEGEPSLRERIGNAISGKPAEPANAEPAKSPKDESDE